MAYHGYIGAAKRYLHALQTPPRVLEIGLDKGTTTIPLVAFLTRAKEEFLFVGIDIKVQEHLGIILANLDRMPSQQVMVVENNSLTVLPDIVNQGITFDLVLIDGDHNYHTVTQELSYLEALTTERSLVIIDDYSGRWAEKDLWYAEREGYEEVNIATSRVDTEKHGVKAAVDDFLESHPGWYTSQPIKGEPIILSRVPLKVVEQNETRTTSQSSNNGVGDSDKALTEETTVPDTKEL